MPKVKERQYRNVAAALQARAAETDNNKLIDCENYVDGYATTFNDPYLLWECEDGTKVYEVIDRNALKDADMSDVIMQYDHIGKVYARQSNKTLVLKPNEKGLRMGADLGRTDGAKELYNEISAGMITRMSWAFVIAPDGEEITQEDKVITRTITKITKVYDVSAVSIPANNDTEIEARSIVDGSRRKAKQELLKKRVKLLKIKAEINAK